MTSADHARHPTLLYRLGFDLPPHVRVFAGFFLYALALGGFFPRIAEVQHALGVAEGVWGMAMIGAPVGTMVSLTFGSRVIERVGYRPVLLCLVPMIALCFALASFANGPLMLFALLVPAGVVIGAVEQIVNIEADRVEHQLGRRIMNRAHAFWSFGFFGAGLLGALASKLHISPQVHLQIMVPVIVLGTVLLLGRFEPAPHRTGTSTEASSHFARPTWAITVLVMVSFAAMVLEGAGIDWSAIYMRDVFAASPFLAGFAVATGALAQAITRFFADRFVERYSPAGVVRTLLTVLGIGALTVFLATHSWMGLLGFALMGVGTSAIFPLAMSAAAQLTDRPAAINVAALAQTSFVAFLLGPPLLGFVAEHAGIRWSFGVGLPLVLLGFAASAALVKKPQQAQISKA